MRKLSAVVLIGLLLTQCDSDDAGRSLTFDGHIRRGDTDPQIPLDGIWVKIRFYDDALTLLEADSMQTDGLGNYSFRINDAEILKRYSVVVRHPYFFQCSNFFSPIESDFVLPYEIDKSRPIADTLSACNTGKVHLAFTKLNVAAKDTLVVTPKIKVPPSLTFIDYPTTVSKDMELNYYYFTKSVTGVEYHFTLKKENGEMSNWVVEQPVESQTTGELSISF